MANLKVLNINGTAYNIVDAEGRNLISGLDTRLKTAEGDIDSIEGKIATLIGEVSGDDAKSVRTISAEEVAKIVAGADTNFDTLKEIADWIKSDTTGAAKMANDIAQNASDIKAINDGLDEFMTGTVGESNGAGTIFDQLTSINSELESLGGGAGSIANQITTEIQKLDAEVTSTDGTNIQVKVTEVDGKITGVNITKDTTYSKPTTGIPEKDLDSVVVSNLTKASTALQEVEGSTYVEVTDKVNGKQNISVKTVDLESVVKKGDGLADAKNTLEYIRTTLSGALKSANGYTDTEVKKVDDKVKALATGIDANFTEVSNAYDTLGKKVATATKETFSYDAETETLTITSSAI